MSRIQRAFGLWESPLSPRAASVRSRLSDVQWDDDGETLVWLESRGDQSYLMAQTGVDAPRELATGVRGRVGYGGGEFTVGGGCAVFIDAKSGRLCHLPLSCASGSILPRVLTPKFGGAASPRLSADRHWVAYVHHDDDDQDRIAIVDVEGKFWPQILVRGADFYAYPRFSQDGKWFAWIQWHNPQMPWDGSELMLAPLLPSDDGGLPRLGSARVIAGRPDVAIFQPEFADGGKTLVYVSDESGYSQLYEHDVETRVSRQMTRLEAEHGAPAWVQEMRTYAIAGSQQIFASINRGGSMRVEVVERATGDSRPLSVWEGYTDVMQLATTVDGQRLAAIASSSQVSPRLVSCDYRRKESRIIARTSGEALAVAALAQAEPITWQTQGGELCHGFYYRPTSEHYQSSGVPPLVVVVHGGPTGQADAGFDMQIQFLATRGYAVLAVNHRGSTGFGRAYMLKLRRSWGLVDVEDCISGMRHLVAQGVVDGRRTAIMGASAGGYTVLQTMATHPEAFTAGISSYGIANQFTLAADTHKFERCYNDFLLGVLPADAGIYRERSPLFQAQQIKRPLAIFQGEDDQVVPKDQAEILVKALQRNSVPHVYHLYKGEGHGWRKTETIEHYFAAIESFLRQQLVLS